MLDHYKEIRNRMVEAQIASRGINDRRVLSAFRKIPRHRFVEAGLQSRAYEDYPLSIGSGQTISQPYMVALMTERLSLTGGEKVLEIGTGSGYQTAILAELAGEVYSLERIFSLAQRAGEKLNEMGYTNVKIEVGDGTLGWPEYSPYDRILVTAGSPEVPQPLIEQLGGKGKLIIPVGGSFGQMLRVVEKTDKGLKKTDVCGCVFVPLVGKFGWENNA